MFVNGLWLAQCCPPGKGHLPSGKGDRPPSQDVQLYMYYKIDSEGWGFFTFTRDAVRKTKFQAASEASLEQGGSVVFREQAMASLPSSDGKGHQRPLHKGHHHLPR